MATSRSKPTPRHKASSKTAAKKAPVKKAAGSRSATPAPTPGILSAHASDLVALGLATLAVLTVLAVWFHALGPVGHSVDKALGTLFGTVRFLVPLLLGGIVAILFVTRETLEPPRLWVGGIVGLLSITGLAGLLNGNPSIHASSSQLRKAGGVVGVLVGHTLSRLIGSIGTAVVLVALLFVAVVVATGMPLRTAILGSGRGLRSAGSVAATWWR